MLGVRAMLLWFAEGCGRPSSPVVGRDRLRLTLTLAWNGRPPRPRLWAGWRMVLRRKSPGRATPPAGGNGAGPAALGADGVRRTSPSSARRERKVWPVSRKFAATFSRNGSNLLPRKPTGPSQSEWATLRLKPGTRSLANVLESCEVVHPVRPGSLACSRSYPMLLVLMLRSRIFRELVPAVSPGAGRVLPSKFWLRVRKSPWVGGVRNSGAWPARVTARANSSGSDPAGE